MHANKLITRKPS